MSQRRIKVEFTNARDKADVRFYDFENPTDRKNYMGFTGWAISQGIDFHVEPCAAEARRTETLPKFVRQQ